MLCRTFVTVTPLPTMPHNLSIFSSKGMGPLPWSEILSFWYIWLPTSILGAAWCTFEFDDEPLFWEKFKKKRGKRE